MTTSDRETRNFDSTVWWGMLLRLDRYSKGVAASCSKKTVTRSHIRGTVVGWRGNVERGFLSSSKILGLSRRVYDYRYPPRIHGRYSLEKIQGFSSSSHDNESSEALLLHKQFRHRRPRRSLVIATFLSLFAIVGVGWYSLMDSGGRYGETASLKSTAFTCFSIVDKEQITANLFILTLRPKNPMNASWNAVKNDPYTEIWQQAVWAVEFKQPRLMVSRWYTPLPPVIEEDVGETDGEHVQKRDLRFLIRKESLGEVSSYISNLHVGDDIELRGPKTHVDLTHLRAADVVDNEEPGEVLFLAGGTGIAPALQVVNALLEDAKIGISVEKAYNHTRDTPKKSQIRILWAVRNKDECTRGSVVEQLKTMQRRHSDHLKVEYFVDEEKRFITRNKLALHLSSTKEDQGRTQRAGEKSLFVSGPEGFKTWLLGRTDIAGEGKMRSSDEVGGLVGSLTSPGGTWKVCYL